MLQSQSSNRSTLLVQNRPDLERPPEYPSPIPQSSTLQTLLCLLRLVLALALALHGRPLVELGDLPEDEVDGLPHLRAARLDRLRRVAEVGGGHPQLGRVGEADALRGVPVVSGSARGAWNEAGSSQSGNGTNRSAIRETGQSGIRREN